MSIYSFHLNICAQPGDVPFEIRHIRCIEYTYTPRGMRIFSEALNRTFKKNVKLILETFSFVLPHYPAAIALALQPNIPGDRISIMKVRC